MYGLPRAFKFEKGMFLHVWITKGFSLWKKLAEQNHGALAHSCFEGLKPKVLSFEEHFIRKLKLAASHSFQNPVLECKNYRRL